MSRSPITEEQWEAARAMWEADTKVSYNDVGNHLGISKQAVGKRAKDQKWQRRMDLDKVINRAHQQADRAAVEADLRKANRARAASEQVSSVDEPSIPGDVLDAPATAPTDTTGMTPEQRAEQMAVDKRAEVLTRHRTELNGARSLVYSAMRIKAPDEGFLAGRRAKVTAEALAIVQAAERKAWGLDKAEEAPTTIVVERG